MLLGTGFRVGWVIQFSCVLVSALLIVRLSVDASASVNITAADLSSLARSMKVRCMTSIAATKAETHSF